MVVVGGGVGRSHTQEGEPASCFQSSVVHTVVLHFMSLVTDSSPVVYFVLGYMCLPGVLSPGLT